MGCLNGGKTEGNNPPHSVSQPRVRPSPSPCAPNRIGTPADGCACACLLGAAMSEPDWRAFEAELRTRVPELALELLGNPTFRVGQEWRWGRKGSLSVVVSGDKAGMWFDHEIGQGGGFIDLVGRDLRMVRSEANNWIADRIGKGGRVWPVRQRPAPRAITANVPTAQPLAFDPASSPGIHMKESSASVPIRADETARRAARIWSRACPALDGHAYLTR